MMGLKLLLAGLLLMNAAFFADTFAVKRGNEVVSQVNTGDYTVEIPGLAMVDERRLAALTARIAAQIDRPPVNARIDGAGNIVPEQPGLLLDRSRFEELLVDRLLHGGAPEIEAPVRMAYPRVDSEILSNIRLNTIGYYVTFYNARNQGRSSNIELAARTLNNTVMFPGERLSFNAVLGERTKGKGYVKAPVIVRGELYEGIGGGICQVSSTLFNAADRAGLTIVERYSHSRNVHYVPTGRDAAVSWRGPDLVLQNPYNHPVLVMASAGAGGVQVSVYSSDMLETRPREVPGASSLLPEEKEWSESDAPEQLEPMLRDRGTSEDGASSRN